MSFDKSQSAGFLANQMARLFARSLQTRIAPLGLAPAQFMTLLALWEADGLTQKQLVERLDVEQATMANTLARMERDGLIVRRTHAADARAQCIYLTPRAIGMRDDATQAASMVNAIAMKGLSPQEAQQFLKLMTRVIGALKVGDDED